MSIENPYAPPESDVKPPPRRGFTRSYQIEGALLRVKEGAFLPDVCLYSGKQEGKLARNTKQFFWNPPWLVLIFFLILALSWILESGIVVLAGVIVAIPVTLMTRKSAVVHYAFVRSSFLIRKFTGFLAVLIVPGTVGFAIRFLDSGLWRYFTVLGASICVAFVIVQRVRGFHVKNIDHGWVTFVRVHPVALQVLAELKEAKAGSHSSGGALMKTQ